MRFGRRMISVMRFSDHWTVVGRVEIAISGWEAAVYFWSRRVKVSIASREAAVYFGFAGLGRRRVVVEVLIAGGKAAACFRMSNVVVSGREAAAHLNLTNIMFEFWSVGRPGVHFNLAIDIVFGFRAAGRKTARVQVRRRRIGRHWHRSMIFFPIIAIRRTGTWLGLTKRPRLVGRDVI